MENKLVDTFNRVHNYLRISLTDNCNLRCFYCMPEEDYDFTPTSRLMQPNEINTIAKIFVEQGVNKIRLTGGEPLVRKDAAEIILSLSQLRVNLTMTTNGTRIHEFINLLKEAGLVASTSEAFRLIQQGAVRIDGERVESRDLELAAGAHHTYQVGKRRVARVRVR